jgi:hypothetical protein
MNHRLYLILITMVAAAGAALITATLPSDALAASPREAAAASARGLATPTSTTEITP